MKKFYITTSIPYTNDAPHLGHALEFVQADVLARYKKQKGYEVFFSSGADEHGAKNVRSAEKARKSVREFVDENTAKFKNILKELNISNDDFLRTSDETRHFPGAQKLWKKLEEKGDIYKAYYKGLYCVGCEAFITEKDLTEGKCEIHNKEPEIIEEENYFFRLSKYTDEIKSKIESGELNIIPESRKNEILFLINEGLEDVSFSRPSRDISWGVPVPGDASHTMYVWCDALSNYITVLGYGSGDELKFNKFWPADAHIIGKDILRFHSVIWPGMLLSAGLPLPENIFVHGFITMNGKKMSKTLGNVTDPFELLNDFGADALRYYFISEISTFQDGDLSREKFLEIYNADLANGIGNLVQRSAKMTLQYFDGVLNYPGEAALSSVPLTKNFNFAGKKENSAIEECSIYYLAKNFILPKFTEEMDNFELNKAIKILWSFISSLDKYIDEYKPFILIKSDKEKTASVLWNVLYGILFLSDLLQPFLPETALKISKIIAARKGDSENFNSFEINTRDLPPLFPRK